MLDLYEQKETIQYLISAIEYMKKDLNSSFCLEKVTEQIETINNFYKTKQIIFGGKQWQELVV